MKAIYLAGSVIMTFLMLILAFENINSMLTHFYFLFFPLGQYDGFFLVLGLEILGILIGIFLTLFITGLIRKTEEEDAGGEMFA